VSWRRLKHLASIAVSNVDKKTVSDERSVRLCNYTDVYYNERITAELPFMKATASTDQIASFGLRAGDVLLTKDSETPDDIAVPAYVVADLPDVVCGYHLALLRPSQEVDGRYLFWALCSRLSREQFSASANGITRFGLRYDSFGEVLVPLPPIATQRAIADYLDQETARIDALIERKQWMKELLQERRQALITEAISRNHDPRATTGGDRVTVRLRHVAAVNPPTPEFELLPDTAEFPFFPLEAIWPGDRLVTTRHQCKAAVSSGYTRFREGDILLPKITPTFQADRTVIANGLEGGVGAGTTELHVVRAGPDADVRYLRYLLSSKNFLDEGEASMIGVAGQKRVPDDYLRNLTVPVVHLHQQRAIADYLDRETAHIDGLIERIDRQVALLRERRQALITAAVTGELEIPGAAV
jgi:type I restriction enzyme S subunit